MNQGGLTCPSFAADEDDREAGVQNLADLAVLLGHLDGFKRIRLGNHRAIPDRGMGRLPVQFADVDGFDTQDVLYRIQQTHATPRELHLEWAQVHRWVPRQGHKPPVSGRRVDDHEVPIVPIVRRGMAQDGDERFEDSVGDQEHILRGPAGQPDRFAVPTRSRSADFGVHFDADQQGKGDASMRNGVSHIGGGYVWSGDQEQCS